MFKRYFNLPSGTPGLLFLIPLLCAFAAQGQYAFTDLGASGSYSQNFESFDGTAGTVPANWTNSFNDYTPGGFYSNLGPWNSALSTYALNQDGTGEIAFGSKVGASGGLQTLTLSCVNNISGGTITGFEVSWDAEQYSEAGRATTLNFSFSAGGTINGTTLTTATTGSPNGNLAVATVTNRSITISDLNIANGGTFNFIWTIATGSSLGDNAHMGLDNVVITPLGALPIKLISFKATAGKTVTDLFWRTATETGNDYFSVERSGNGREFTEIGRVNGAGTSHAPKDYRFSDETPLPGANFYRLRQVDFDGAFSYSPVVSAVFGKHSAMLLYPSPATGELNLELENPSEEASVWQIFDQTGRMVQSGELPGQTLVRTTDVSNLPPGIYTIRVNSGSQTMAGQFCKH